MERIFEAVLEEYGVTIMIDLDAVSQILIRDGRLWFTLYGVETAHGFSPRIQEQFIEAWKKWKGPTSEQ